MQLSCNCCVQLLTSTNTCVLTDVSRKHRHNHTRGEPAAYTDHRFLSAYPPSGVEQISRPKIGGLWMSICINTSAVCTHVFMSKICIWYFEVGGCGCVVLC